MTAEIFSTGSAGCFMIAPRSPHDVQCDLLGVVLRGPLDPERLADAHGIVDLDGCGTAFYSRFYLSVPAITELGRGRLMMPGGCVQCGREPVRVLRRLCESKLPPNWRGTAAHLEAFVWLCGEHIGMTPPLTYTLSFEPDMHATACEAYATNRDFLVRLRERNTRHEMYPPWVVFPASTPASDWQAEPAGSWWRGAWEPYWGKLTDDARRQYLYHWSAPPEWETLTGETRAAVPVESSPAPVEAATPAPSDEYTLDLRD